jgi:hypothetical protein
VIAAAEESRNQRVAAKARLEYARLQVKVVSHDASFVGRRRAFHSPMRVLPCRVSDCRPTAPKRRPVEMRW